MTEFLINKHNQQNGSAITINKEAVSELQNHPFPGNVRELENILERALALCEDDVITPEDLQLPEITPETPQLQAGLGEMTRDLEKEQIANALQDNRWNQSATARALGLTLRQLRYRIEKLGLRQ